MEHTCGECLKLQEALIVNLSSYATFLKAQNHHYREGSSEAAGQVSASINRADTKVTEARSALDDHRELKHRQTAQ